MRAAALAAVLAAAAIGVSPADASQLIDRGTTGARLAIDPAGRAVVTYHAGGAQHTIVAWGAINARAPSERMAQVEFTLRYGARYPGSACRRYDGPSLAWIVAACKASDGSWWALQSWSRILRSGTRRSAATRELRLSHWRGELPQLAAGIGWVAGTYHRLAGRLTYRGQPVYGFHTTRTGNPLDGYGRNVYVDTLDSAYGAGWRRENGFLTRAPSGAFCYGLFPRGGRPSGMGAAYRATVIGPGVTPDVAWAGRPPAHGLTRARTTLACPR